MRLNGLALVAALCCANASAQQSGSETSKTNYVLGLKFKAGEELDGSSRNRFSPAFGIRLGRWKIGTNPNLDEWLSFSGIRKDPTVSYDFSDSPRWKAVVSARIQNLSTGEAFDLGDKGKNTLRGRLLLTYRATDTINVATELTQDILNRGDGTTLTLGVSKAFGLGPKSLLVASSAITFANAVHWRTANKGFVGSEKIGSGVGSLALGLGYRFAYSKEWALYANSGFTRPLFEVQDVRGSNWRSSGQIGILYFGQF